MLSTHARLSSLISTFLPVGPARPRNELSSSSQLNRELVRDRTDSSDDGALSVERLASAGVLGLRRCVSLLVVAAALRVLCMVRGVTGELSGAAGLALGGLDPKLVMSPLEVLGTPRTSIFVLSGPVERRP